MGAAAGKQFQSEKAKHAQAVLTAVEVFDESNQQPDDNNGGVSTEFFKKKVMLAATDAKRKGKDIEKSLAQLTDADLDMLAHYVGNRKDEERRLAGSNGANAMQVEEIADDGDNAADNIDETTSVLSYGDDEEEAADNDEMDSSGELIENIEEVVETRPRLNSGFKVFPMDGNEEAKNGAGEVSSSNSNQKSKLKLELDPPHSGIADHIAKFWDDELGSLASQATHGPGTESPTLSPTSTVIGKKFQPSPKQSFPYKDRGQRIDERNETLMVLQRQKVISLTQNAQLEREVEALQRQLEKMDQIDQTFESSRGLSGTNKSVNNSLNNTAGSSTSSKTVNGMQKYSYGHTDFTNSTGYGSGNLQAKYSYIYPIDEEISQSIDHSSSKDDAHTHLRKVGGERGSDAKVSAGGSGNHGSPAGVISGIGSSLAASRRNRRDRAAKGGSSPSSSDNDSTNSFGKIASKYRGGSLSSGGGGGGGGGGPIAAAQSKGGGIMRVKSNDPSDLSDGEAPSVPTQPSLGKVGKAHSSFIPVSGVPSSGGGVGGIGTGAGVGAGAGAGANPSRLPRRTGRGILSHDGGDSDDSAQHPRFGGAAAAQQSGYNPSHPSHHPSLRIAPKLSHQQAASDINDHQAKHGSVESDSESQHDGIRSGKNSQSTKAQNRRIVVANARAAAQGSVTLEEADSKRRDINAGTSSTATAHSHSSNVSPKLGRGRRLTSDDPKQVGSPARLAGEATASAVSELGDKKYQALLENVSLHLEAVGKEHPQKDIGAIADSAVVGSKAGFSRKGGALKKLNKRRHSMDGLEDTDTSQDEVDSSPGGISKFRKYGRNAAATAADAPDKTPQGAHGNAQGIANGGGSRLAPSEEPGSYATTDDESVGPGGAHQNSINSSHMLGQAAKGRRPRTKLQVQTNASSPQGASSTATAEDGPGYQPSSHSHAPDKLHNSADHAAAVTASTATATDCSAAVTAAGEGGDGTGAAAGATVSTKAKRRVRAQVSSKAKGEAASVLIEGGVSGASSSADATASSAPVAATPTSPWDSELDQWWAEVSLLLRKPILQEEDMLYTVAAAEAGLIYTEEMNSIAKTLNVLRGALSRWILPYDNNTRIDSQCSTPHSVVENMPEEFRGKLTERQVHYLVAGANGVRKLIRVKIADDNDLEQARKALKSTDMFFKALYHRAKQANMQPYKLLQMAENFHC